MTTSATLSAKTQFIDIAGARLAYRRFGTSSGTPLLCLQHFTGTLDLWDPAVFDELCTEREIILLENAGVALSTGKTPDTIATMAEAAIAFLDALNLTEVDILGFSLGGFLAQYIALQRPALIRRLILSGTGPEGGAGTSMNDPRLLPIFGDTKMAMTEKLKRLFFPENEAAQAAAAAYIERISQREQDRDTGATGEVAMQQLKAMGAWEANNGDAFASLSKITQPVLVTNGDYDTMIPTPNSLTFKQHLPNATLIVYPNAGHGALYQYPDAYVAHVSTFLR
jgi:pimeloyl-ACP methyl ester carboxylesterase